VNNLEDDANKEIKLIEELADDRMLVVSKTDNIYEVFVCDQCAKQVKSANIYLCETCNFDFGLCERCFLDKVAKREDAHSHNLICVPNTFYKPYNISFHHDIKYANDEMTVQLLACHPLTTQLEIIKDGEVANILFSSKLYIDKIVSNDNSIDIIMEIIPIIIKSSDKSTLILLKNG